MFRVLLAFSFFLVLAAGCGETRHPVRRETLTPATPEAEDPVEGADSAFHGNSEPALPPGHPPMSTMPRGTPDMPPASADLDISPPDGWVQVEPASGMIQAEFSLPKTAGDENDGRVTVMVAGGSIDANIDRWRTQFEGLEEKPVEKLDVSGTKATLVDFSGTFSEQRGMGPTTKRPGYRMLAAIIERPDEMLFVKAYGPKNTMSEHVEKFRDFVESLAAPAK